ncbi:MAG: Gfo/Idh/MocA family oxidoreductase [Bythopirellula sp.]|nr:Gfo/Idh/MocA family oxidoreductase [Bythopirellula sp.]
MIRVGIAGVGFMGMVHYLSYQKLRGVKVAALCESNTRRLKGDWRDIRGNFGPPGQMMDLSGVATYTDIDEMLADESLDMIDVTLPPALHADVAIKALRAGKHVFCEKPMALTVRDCDRMSTAAKQAKKLLFIGHVLPFFPEYAWALKTIQSGKFGTLLGGSFRRVISEPTWLANYWNADQVGGPMLDLHVHDAHFIRLLFGKPHSVVCRGRMREGLAQFWHSQFDYGPEGPVVSATSGTIDQQGRSFNHGFEIHLEKATLLFEFAILGDQGAYLVKPTILVGGKVQHPEMPDGDPMHAFAAELQEVLRCARREERSQILDASLARDAIVLCHKQSESLCRRCFVRM